MKIKIIILYLTIIYLLIASLDVVSVANNHDYSILMFVLFAGGYVFFMLIQKKLHCMYIEGSVIGLVSLLIVITMITNNDYSGLTIIMLWCIGGLFVSNFEFKTVCNAYSNIIKYISIFSLFGMALQLFLPQVVKMAPIVNGPTVTELKNFIITVIPTKYSNLQIRNYGVFREPGIFGIYICLALLIEVVKKSRIVKKTY